MEFPKEQIIQDNLEHWVDGDFGEDEYTLPTKIRVENWVVIDDIDMRKYGGEHRHLVAEHHFVLTLMKTGLTRHNVEQARRILEDKEWMGPEKCEHCTIINTQWHDTEINKYFCGAECQKAFHQHHQLHLFY